MKNSTIQSNEAVLDQLIAETIVKDRPASSTELQQRILQRTALLAQEKSTGRSAFTLVSEALLSLKFSLTAIAASAFLALILVASPWQSQHDSAELMAVSESSTEIVAGGAESGLLSEQEIQSETFTDMVWDEVWLLEDELAFAAL